MSWTCELGLRPTGASERPRAWLIPSAEPARWLTLLAPLAESPGGLGALELYLVPSSLADRRPSGLIVADPEGEHGERLIGALPLAERAGRLWLPARAELDPPVSDGELRAELSGRALLHPALGLIGFEASDRKGITDLVAAATRRDEDWGRAQSWEPLRCEPISIIGELPPRIEEMLAEGAGELAAPPRRPKERPPGAPPEEGEPPPPPEDGEAPEADPPGAERRPEPPEGEGQAPEAEEGGQGGWLKRGVARAAKWFTDRAPVAEDAEPTWVNRLEDWASGVLKEPPRRPPPRDGEERQKGRPPPGRSGKEPPKRRPSGPPEDPREARQRELERLLKLLDEDPEEGLRQAMPLGGQSGGGGGQDDGSTRLGRRESLDFDLGARERRATGGGWSVNPDLIERLRRRYGEAARREVGLGRHRRAAYIFSQLLGDDLNAALALMAGGHHREAARLFRERLGKPWEAARCLDAGGFPEEALEVYRELKAWREVGQLERRLGREDAAVAAFRQEARVLRSRGEVVEAAQVLESEARDPEAALHLLRGGWPQGPQAKGCLQAEMELLARHERHEEARERLELVLEAPCPLLRLPDLAEVTAKLARSAPDLALRERAEDGARVLIGGRLPQAGSREAEALLQSLRHLAPGDDVLIQDSWRYERDRVEQDPPRLSSEPRILHRFQLPPGNWLAAQSDGSSLFAVGLDAESQAPLIARFYEGGQVQSRRLPRDPATAEAAAGPAPAILAASSWPGLPVAVSVPGAASIPELRWAATGLGDEPRVTETPAWLGAGALAAAYGPRGFAWVLREDTAGTGGFALSCYEPRLERSIHELHVSPPDPPEPSSHTIARLRELIEEEGDPWSALSFQAPEDPEHRDVEAPLLAALATARAISAGGKLLILSDGGDAQVLDLGQRAVDLAAMPGPEPRGLLVGLFNGAMWLPNVHRPQDATSFGRQLLQPRGAITPQGHILLAVTGKAHLYRRQRRGMRYAGDISLPESEPIAVLPGATAQTLVIVTRNGSVVVLELPL